MRYTQRKREKNRETERRYALVAHERAGDVARDYNFHAAAARHYEDALNTVVTTSPDALRITEKLINVLFLSGDPTLAGSWLDDLLGLYLADRKKSTESVDLLSRVSWQLWLDAKTILAVSIDEKMIRVAELSGNAGLRKRALTVAAGTLNTLGRFTDASKSLSLAGDVDSAGEAATPRRYHRNLAIVSAAGGQIKKAYEHFNLAVDLAKNESNPYSLTIVWETYALWALALGDTQSAKSYYERALLVTRQNSIIWRIPYLCLDYADLLARMGQEHTAFEYLLEAVSYDAPVPVLRLKFAAIGIPLALTMNDSAVLAKCAFQNVIELAFLSGQPCRVGPVAVAFARLYTKRGQIEQAQTLLHRAIECVTYIDESFDLPIEIARHGFLADIPRARQLLLARLNLPSAGVARALLGLFEMLVAQREKRSAEVSGHAKQAAQAFSAIHWYGYAKLARSVLPKSKEHSDPRLLPLHRPFSDIRPALTQREQEVAELALRRLTNREIAETLSISEHTVEKHMTSIMDRLSIRSRRQLADVLRELPGS